MDAAASRDGVKNRPESADVSLDDARSADRRFVTPQYVNDRLWPHWGALAERQQAQDRALAGGEGSDIRPVPRDPHRAQYPDPEAGPDRA
jgi:hypothetical protein